MCEFFRTKKSLFLNFGRYQKQTQKITVIIYITFLENSRGLLIMKQTMNKEDLINMGYNPYTAVSIIRQAKQIMVQKGYAFYNNRRLGHVPISAVEEILGVSLHEEG